MTDFPVRVIIWSGSSMCDPIEIVTALMGKVQIGNRQFGIGVKLPDDYTAEDVEKAWDSLYVRLRGYIGSMIAWQANGKPDR